MKKEQKERETGRKGGREKEGRTEERGERENVSTK